MTAPVSSPTIELFNDQLNQLLNSIALQRGLESADKALPFWYVETFLDLNEAESADVVTEGSNDLGIDALVISDDEDTVTFFQFKNPTQTSKGIGGGDIDKVISGLDLILQRAHKKIANARLRERVEEIHQKLRRSYRLVAVSTGGGLPGDAIVKLDALKNRWTVAGTSLLSYDCVDIARLQELYYNKTLPTLDGRVEVVAPEDPYAVQLGSHRSFIFHVPGTAIAHW